MKIAVLGGNGLLGSDLVRYMSSKFSVTSITRANYDRHKNKRFDIFINANGNSRRYWALQNVYKDFEASTVSVYKTLDNFNFKKYIYISSVDVYPDTSSPLKTSEKLEIDITKQNSYGFHKFLSEQLVRKFVSDWLIFRPSNILGSKLGKGPIFDALNKIPLYISEDSKLQFITTRAISEIIKTLIAKSVSKEIFNLGGIGTLDFRKTKKFFKEEIKVSPEAKKQVYEMNVEKLKMVYLQLKTSEEYLQEFLIDFQ
ncbi:hypothetical protein A2714_02870 [Candidatus Woesebacteria bacterium RIFCSPHIGHO2_01_FULL_38_9]|uniref:UDP-glucose 4-epimerase n=2 Tax=Candidatus Woeseibacteriota TaxID=1752722 RepID=A0A1F7XZW0_9BACT|nr:MAG: hypothetical protein A2714_02870 [Candidatus Woesebacteria bacterium RIFCSPHIGHO2_01_FULL_38_9]OGM60583.1 MAG: hypothetical protein A3A75_03620 [Candidatus Woesebacteria bacterium RIFCSPLOWO2_01_FULL_39_10]